MTCRTRLADDPHGLACTNPAPHEPHHGCVYQASDCPDAVKDEEVAG